VLIAPPAYVLSLVSKKKGGLGYFRQFSFRVNIKLTMYHQLLQEKLFICNPHENTRMGSAVLKVWFCAEATRMQNFA
jgi:hypothetical protein